MTYAISSANLAFSGKGVAAYLRVLNILSAELDTQFLVVGAFARDLLLVHHLGSEPGVGTQDIDIGIWLPDWDAYRSITDRLQSDYGFSPARGQHVHAFVSRQDLRTDILPFGSIEERRQISFPRFTSFQLNMMGFQEAVARPLYFILDDNVPFTTPSTAGMVLLKLIAWKDRRGQQIATKHVVDIARLLDAYFDGTIDDRVDEPLILAAFDATEPLDHLWYHSAWVIGHEMALLCQNYPETRRTVLGILDDILSLDEAAYFLTPLSWHIHADEDACRRGIGYLHSSFSSE
jgi:predicted nucleotidyltransferase